MAVHVDLRAVELICSRLCHELINPIGAVNNGVELLSELEGGADPEALALVAQSARAAAARLQFYRLAYGLAGGSTAELSLAEAGAFAADAVTSTRIALEWPRSGPAGERRPGRGPIKLLLNLCVLAAEALPRGGRLALGSQAEALEVTAAGAGAALAGETLAAFKGELEADALSPRNVHGYFAGQLSRALELPVAVEESRDLVRFRLALPRAA
jgi:histidine phosphotransferase ChpT